MRDSQRYCCCQRCIHVLSSVHVLCTIILCIFYGYTMYIQCIYNAYTMYVLCAIIPCAIVLCYNGARYSEVAISGSTIVSRRRVWITHSIMGTNKRLFKSGEALASQRHPNVRRGTPTSDAALDHRGSQTQNVGTFHRLLHNADRLIRRGSVLDSSVNLTVPSVPYYTGCMLRVANCASPDSNHQSSPTSQD